MSKQSSTLKSLRFGAVANLSRGYQGSNFEFRPRNSHAGVTGLNEISSFSNITKNLF